MNTKSLLVRINDIDCASCAKTLSESLKSLDGISDVVVDAVAGTARIEYDPQSVAPEKMAKAVETLGYTVIRPGNSRCVLTVDGLCCSEEERTIRTTFSKYPWILNSAFNIPAGRITIDHSGSEKELLSILRGAGFPAWPQAPSSQAGSPGWATPHTKPGIVRRSWYRMHASAISTSISGVCAAAGILLSWTGTPPATLIPLFALSIIVGGWRIALKGWKSAVVMTFDMNFLMTVAVIGAVGIGKWTEAAFVIFLFAFAQLLESFSMRRSRKAIQNLLDLSPPEASVLRDNTESRVPVDAIEPGEVILIRPGERLPLDGRVISGATTVDQSPITGESLPASKHPGDPVFAGTINRNGTIEVRVTALAQNSTLSHIIHMIEKAQEQRAPSQQLVDRFSKYYSPSVILISLATVIVPTLLFTQPFSVWFYRGLVLLVIACPCALVLSTPISIVSALTRASRDGILIKGGAYLEEASRIRAIAFDKTGTLTQGKLEVTDVVRIDELSENEILSMAAALESKSEHPLGRTIIAYAAGRGISIDGTPINDFLAIPGRGISARVDGTQYYLGNHALAEEHSFCSGPLESVIGRLEAEGKSLVILGRTDEAIGVIAIADTQREEGRRTIEDLRLQGVEHFAILTGDNIQTAKNVANSLGIEEVHAGLLPLQKVESVVRLKQKYEKVAMVGDGINDAPALAASSIGIAMGAIGSDAAIETADVALMSDDLSKLSVLRHLSTRTLRIIRQNIILSILIKVVFLTLAIGGYSTLWMAIAADEGASLLVIANGLRLLRSPKSAPPASDIEIPHCVCHTNIVNKV